MKKPRILVVSAKNALRYVMRHFCEPGVTEYAEKNDTYAAISIQDTYGGGFGFELKKNRFCVLKFSQHIVFLNLPEVLVRLKH